MKRILLLICTLLCANVLSAQTFVEEGIKYLVTGAGEVRAWGLQSTYTSANIPSSVTHAWTHYSTIDSVRTYSVTSIGMYAIPGSFVNNTYLTSVTIPNSVTSIGHDAFGGCGNLTYVIFEDNSNLTSIGDDAFYGCSSLTSIDIPNSVTSIGDYAFGYCSSLTSVDIPNSVTYITEHAFWECISLTSVTIPNSVTSIGDYAFRGCSSLTSVTIPNSVTYIGEHAFWECISLTSVTIPNSVTYIGEEAFGGIIRISSNSLVRSSLTSVTCLATNPPALEEHAFYDIGSPSTLYVPNGCGEAYENSSWAQYFDCIVELGSGVTSVNIDVEVNNEEWGSVEVDEGCGTATLTAVVEEDCSEFLRWSDGDTNNPRVVNVASDTSFTAIFKDPVLDTTINATIMQGETYNFNGQELNEEGVYSATVLSVLGCEINLTINLYVISNDYTNGETSSLQETEVEEIVFYPNPTKGLISFSKSIEKIEVVDISGKILLSFSNVREINIGDLPEGSYLLRLHSNENSVLRKIVKE